MIYLHTRCPHCREMSGFIIYAASEYSSSLSMAAAKIAQDGPYGADNSSRRKPVEINLSGTCTNCGKPAIFETQVFISEIPDLKAHISNIEKRYLGPEPEILRVWPEARKYFEHPSLPDSVKKPMLDLQKMIDERINAAFIVAGCRSVLEEAIKNLGGEGKTLIEKIKNLKEQAIISGVLEEWAHEVRLSGNEAVHELKATEEEAIELVEYVKLFLQYTFEFPARINDKRSRKNYGKALS